MFEVGRIRIMPVPPELLQRIQLIGERLISIESHNPGMVRMLANPVKVPEAAHALEVIGFKKRFLQSKTQFLYDCFLSSDRATRFLLPGSILAGGLDANGHRSCWDGAGQYLGWQGVLQLSNFASGGKENYVLIVNCAPFIEQISDLFDPIRIG
jgi:hypothetical protein